MRAAIVGDQPVARLEIVRLAARLGALTALALARYEGSSVASARGRLAVAERAGLLRSSRPLRELPALFTATAAGMREAGIAGLPPSPIGPACARHAAACAAAAAELSRLYIDHLVYGERELRRDERAYGGSLASAALTGAAGALHRPDLVLWPRLGGAQPIAVEVELTVKSPRRLVQICRAWARCRRVAAVLYLTSEQAAGPVARAIREAQADMRIARLPLAELLAGTPTGAGEFERAVADGS